MKPAVVVIGYKGPVDVVTEIDVVRSMEPIEFVCEIDVVGSMEPIKVICLIDVVESMEPIKVVCLIDVIESMEPIKVACVIDVVGSLEVDWEIEVVSRIELLGAEDLVVFQVSDRMSVEVSPSSTTYEEVVSVNLTLLSLDAFVCFWNI